MALSKLIGTQRLISLALNFQDLGDTSVDKSKSIIDEDTDVGGGGGPDGIK